MRRRGLLNALHTDAAVLAVLRATLRVNRALVCRTLEGAKADGRYHLPHRSDAHVSEAARDELCVEAIAHLEQQCAHLQAERLEILARILLDAAAREVRHLDGSRHAVLATGLVVHELDKGGGAPRLHAHDHLVLLVAQLVVPLPADLVFDAKDSAFGQWRQWWRSCCRRY
jgi:hypothetical protein